MLSWVSASRSVAAGVCTMGGYFLGFTNSMSHWTTTSFDAVYGGNWIFLKDTYLEISD